MPIPPEVHIRDALPGELDAVAEQTVACYEEYQPDAAASADTRRAWSEYQLDLADVHERVRLGAVVVVAERAGRILGSVTYYPPGSDKSESGWPDEIAAIRLLGVIPSERGLRIGRALTEECVRRARDQDAPAVGLHTTHLMAVARDMYERMGFVRVPDNDFEASPEILITAYRLEL